MSGSCSSCEPVDEQVSASHEGGLPQNTPIHTNVKMEAPCSLLHSANVGIDTINCFPDQKKWKLIVKKDVRPNQL